VQRKVSHPVSGRSHKLSGVIITKNEADRIGQCLRPLVGWADEIIVVDNGSVDRTVELARRYTPHVIQTHWRGYGKQKQFALEQASHDWVLSLDADEVVSPELRTEIDGVLAGEPSAVAFRIPRQLVAFGGVLRHGDCGHAPIRLFRRDRARFSMDEVHESVKVDGRVRKLRSRLTHHGYRGMEHALARARKYSRLWAAQQYDRGRRVNLAHCLVHGAWSFVGVLIFRGGWLDGRRGFIMAALQSQYTFNKYATLWSKSLTGLPRPAEPQAR